MSYTNVLGLSIFTAMRLRNCYLIMIVSGLRVASNDEICNYARGVWDTIKNEKIAHDFF